MTGPPLTGFTLSDCHSPFLAVALLRGMRMDLPRALSPLVCSADKGKI